MPADYQRKTNRLVANTANVAVVAARWPGQSDRGVSPITPGIHGRWPRAAKCDGVESEKCCYPQPFAAVPARHSRTLHPKGLARLDPDPDAA